MQNQTTSESNLIFMEKTYMSLAMCDVKYLIYNYAAVEDYTVIILQLQKNDMDILQQHESS